MSVIEIKDSFGDVVVSYRDMVDVVSLPPVKARQKQSGRAPAARRRDRKRSGYNELVCESKPLKQAHSVEMKDDPEGES